MSSPSDTDADAASRGGRGDGEKAGAGATTRAEANREAKRDRPAERPSHRPGGPELLIGVTLSGRYLIERLIGEGGMGAVYQAEHTHMRKRLAVKVLHPEMSRLPEVVARFEREAMAAAHIDHPNVAAATDFGKLEDGSFFLVLEYVEGRGLRDVIAEGPLELGRALHVGRQIASALGRAHALGIVHRDLKPENVMLVAREGDPDFVKVLDFGIAKVPIGELGSDRAVHSGPALTQLGMVYGTPEYMAPEQALGQEVDARADLYSLGAIMFEMLAGVRPYEHESKVTLLGMHVTAPIPKMSVRAPGSNVPPAVEAVVAKLLAKEASARFADSKALVEAIDEVVESLVASGQIAEPAQPLSRVQTPGSRNGKLSSNANLALQPTSLAEPAIDARRARLESLVGRSRAALGRALEGAPSWATPERVVVAGGVVLALALFGGVAALSHGGGPATTAVAAGGAASPPPRPPDPQTDDLVAAARAKIEKGDYATAIETLSALEKSGPDRPDVHELLEHAYTGVRNAKDAMREVGLWLNADANAAADSKLEEDVRNAALLKESQDDAFALLESQMGPRGIDILYDIAYGASGRQYPQAAARARHSLENDAVQGRASPALAVLLDFREAKTCEAKRALLDRAHDHGDARLLVILQPYTTSRGCGFLGQRDCYPCMHKDTALRDAISAIEERAAH
jgi:serine/threonine protein kinase